MSEKPSSGLAAQLEGWADETEMCGALPRGALGLCELFAGAKDTFHLGIDDYAWCRRKLHELFANGKGRGDYYWQAFDWASRIKALRALAQLARKETVPTKLLTPKEPKIPQGVNELFQLHATVEVFTMLDSLQAHNWSAIHKAVEYAYKTAYVAGWANGRCAGLEAALQQVKGASEPKGS